MSKENMSSEDQEILELIQEVNKQKAAIAKAEKPIWKTNCSFSYTEGVRNNAINIQVCADKNALVKIAAFLLSQVRCYQQAQESLGINDTQFTWDGYTIEEWMNDLESRAKKIQVSDQKSKLEKLESRLNNIVSPEARRKLELEAIKREMLNAEGGTHIFTR